MQTILVTSGEPSGIGPDICLTLANYALPPDYKIVVIGDPQVLLQRAALLQLQINIREVADLDTQPMTGELQVLAVPCPSHVDPGKLNNDNAQYVLQILDTAIKWCKHNCSHIIVTAPIHKGIINQAGIKFSGHTEYFAAAFGVDKVVMMLANQHLKVALLTTHVALRDVHLHVTYDNLNSTLEIIIGSLKMYGIAQPKIAVCGLNPHAGEGGYIGDEECRIINPVIQHWQHMGYLVSGSYSADTIFLQAHKYDVILAIYHDQGLPVLKYSGFETGINVTLGLPIIRTSVDHGTGLDIAGTGLAHSTSLYQAINYAIACDNLTKNKESNIHE